MQEDGETEYTDAGGWRDGVYSCIHLGILVYTPRYPRVHT
jgi:hypothetical protein